MADYTAGTASIKITPDSREFLTKLREDLDRYSDPGFDVSINPDFARAAAEIDRFLADQSGRQLGLDVDVETAGAVAHLDELRASQHANAINLRVNVDKSSTDGVLKTVNSLFSEVGDIFSTLGSTLKFPLIFTGIGELPAATTAIASLTGALEQLSGAGLAIPGVLGGVFASVGTAKLGLNGVEDAYKALDKAADGSAKNVQAANDALAKLAPNAADAVRTAHDLAGQLEDTLGKPIQNNLFAGVSTDLKQLSASLTPTLQKGLGGVSSALNQDLHQVLDSLGSDSSKGLIDRLLGNTANAEQRFSTAIAPIIHGIESLTAGSSDILPRLADDFGSVGKRFDDFISKADKSGDLDKWINNGVTGLEQLGNSFLNVGKGIGSITDAAGGGQGLFAALETGTKKLDDFLGSSEGQNKLKQWFAEGRDEIQNHIIPLLKDLPGFFTGVVDAGKEIGDTVVPILKNVGDILRDHPDALKDVLELIVGAKILTGAGNLASSLQTIVGLTGKLGGAAGGGGGGGGLAVNRGLAGLGLLAGGTATQALSDSGAGQAAGAGETIAGGALAGSVFGPEGTIVGAGVGATIAGVNFLLAENAKESKAAADAQADYAAKLKATQDAAASMQGAQKDINDSLLNASGATDNADVQQSIQSKIGVLGDSIKANQGDAAANSYAAALQKRGLSTRDLASQVSGTQDTFDALENNLRAIGPGGVIAADQMQKLRDGIQQAAAVGQGAGPTLQELAGILKTDLGGAAADVRTAFENIPQRVPLAIDMPNVPAAVDILKDLGANIQIINGEPIVLNPDDQKVKDAETALHSLGIDITTLPTGEIKVELDEDALARAKGDMSNFFANFRNLIISPSVAPPQLPGGGGPVMLPGQNAPGTLRRAFGGPIMGPGPTGVDSVPIMAAPGEHMLTAGDVDRMGGQAGVYRFRQALQAGKVPGLAGGGNPLDYLSIATGGKPGGLAPGPDVAATPDRVGSPGGGFVGSLLGQFLPGLGVSGSNASTDSKKDPGEWLGEFGAKTLLSFGTALYSGLLGIFGLQDSILSPSNPYFQAVAKSAGFALGEDGPFGSKGGGPGGASKAATPKQIREAQEKVGDRNNAVQLAQARLGELDPKAKDSTRLGAQQQLDKATREAADAQTDLQNLMQYGSGAGAAGDYTSGGLPSAPTSGSGAARWAPVIQQALAQVGPKYGITNIPAWTNAMIGQIQFESGGNEAALNPKDSDGLPAIGLGQFKQGTFNAHNVTGGDINDGVAQVYAMIDYVATRYGQDSSGVPRGINQGHGYAHGGDVAGHGIGDTVPAMLTPGEHVLTTKDVAAMGGQDKVYDFRKAPHFAPGGAVAVPDGVVLPTPRPNFTSPPAQMIIPRPSPPAAAPRPPTLAGPPPPAAAPTAPPPDSTPPPAQPSSPVQSSPGFQVGAAPASLDHNLPAVDTGIKAGASAIGNIAAAAAGAAGFGGGAAGPFIQGLATIGGKAATDVANVVSSFFVGDTSLGSTDRAYGYTARPQQTQPDTLPYGGPGGPARAVQYGPFYGHNTDDVSRFIEQKEAQDRQGFYAHL